MHWDVWSRVVCPSDHLPAESSQSLAATSCFLASGLRFRSHTASWSSPLTSSLSQMGGGLFRFLFHEGSNWEKQSVCGLPSALKNIYTSNNFIEPKCRKKHISSFYFRLLILMSGRRLHLIDLILLLQELRAPCLLSSPIAPSLDSMQYAVTVLWLVDMVLL